MIKYCRSNPNAARAERPAPMRKSKRVERVVNVRSCNGAELEKSVYARYQHGSSVSWETVCDVPIIVPMTSPMKAPPATANGFSDNPIPPRKTTPSNPSRKTVMNGNPNKIIRPPFPFFDSR